MSEQLGEYIVGETLEALTGSLTQEDIGFILDRLGPCTTVRFERTVGDGYTCETWTFEPVAPAGSAV